MDLFPGGFAFEASEWLNGLWALPIIVLLYLFRRRARRILVPFLPFWQRVFADRKRRPSFLRTLLSILLQIIAATAILVALARPYRDESSAEPVPSVVIVDRSLGTCMNSGVVTLADLVVAKAREVVARASREGAVSVALLRGGLEPRGGTGLAVFDGLPQPAGIRSLTDVATLRAASDQRTRIFLVTPFAAGPRELAGVTVIGVARQPLTNGGIRAVAQDPATGELVIRTDPGGGSRKIALVAAEGTTIASVDVPPGPSTEMRLKLPPDAPKDVTVRLDPPDAFAADDAAPLELAERAKLRVLVASDAPTPALDSALLASSIMDAAASGRVALAQLGSVADSFDVAIVVGAGSDFALPPGRYFLIDAFPRGMPIDVKPGGGEARATKKRADVTWLGALDVDEWRIHRMPPVESAAGLDVLVEGTRGPLVARFEQSGIRAVTLSVRPDVAASTLPLLPAFPLMLRGALLELAPRGASGGPVVFRAGGRIVLSASEAAGMIAADGSARPLRLAKDGGGYELPEEAGRFTTGARRIATAWLDHPALPGEARMTDDPWPDVPRRPERRSFQPEVLLILVAVLLAEWCSYHFGGTD